MNIRRILRHLATDRRLVRRLFPPAAMRAIEDAIRSTEERHSGQIRFAVEASLEIPDLLRGTSAHERAIDVFSRLRIWDTEHNNGVLIYLLLADRDVEIVADRGIHAHLGPEGWEIICRAMEQMFRRGEFSDGVLHGIREVGAHLAKHFPGKKGAANELPDKPVVL